MLRVVRLSAGWWLTALVLVACRAPCAGEGEWIDMFTSQGKYAGMVRQMRQSLPHSTT